MPILLRFFFLLHIPSIALSSQILPSLEYWDQTRWDQVQKWFSERQGSEALEMKYQQLVQRQVFSDLMKLYAPENASRVEITYASFAPDLLQNPSQAPLANFGEDVGLGLHVIKRLKVPVSGGGHRLIEVNEHWAEDRKSGGLFFPDELRVKIQVARPTVFAVKPTVIHLFDSFRLAWGPNREIAILRRSRFHSKGSEKQMRVPVSAPFSCLECHHDTDVSEHFASPFLKPGETRNPNRIVQDSHFTIPLGDTKGFQQFLVNLKSRADISLTELTSIEKSLQNPATSMVLPGIREALQQNFSSTQWVKEDLPWARTYSSLSQAIWQQGAYPVAGQIFLDVIEETFEGKYRWWDPEIVIPPDRNYSR